MLLSCFTHKSGKEPIMAKETLIERLESGDGSILKTYGSKTFLSVSPAIEIGMFKIEIVPIKGKGSGKTTVFYMPVESIVQLAEDIQSGVFGQKVTMNNSKGKPMYSYVGGTDGSRQLSFSMGNVGVLAKISNKEGDSWLNQSIALSPTNGNSPLREFARLVLLFTGVWTPSAKSYYAKVLEAYDAGASKRVAMHVPDDAGYAAAEADGFEPVGNNVVPFNQPAPTSAPANNASGWM